MIRVHCDGCGRQQSLDGESHERPTVADADARQIHDQLGLITAARGWRTVATRAAAVRTNRAEREEIDGRHVADLCPDCVARVHDVMRIKQ